MKKIIKITIAVIVLLICTYAVNYVTLKMPAQKQLNEDIRNNGIDFNLHYQYFILPKICVFDLQKISSDKAPMDIFRVLLQTSYALKNREYDTIVLSFRGKPKFILNGQYFKEIGLEYGIQNPIYTIRTFPEHLCDVNGNPVYKEWNGGLLGVLQKQMEDFQDFNKKWYMEDIVK